MGLTKKEIFLIILGILLITNAFFAGQYFIMRLDLKQAELKVQQTQLKRKVVDFTDLFIEKVLRAEEEVGFEDRLELETSVRNLNDEEILIQWQKFTNSGTGQQAQNEVKNLLSLLINKIK